MTKKVLVALATVAFIVCAYLAHDYRLNSQIKAAAQEAAQFTEDPATVWLVVAKINRTKLCLRSSRETKLVEFPDDYPWKGKIEYAAEGEQIIFVFAWPHEDTCDLTKYANFLRPYRQKAR